MHTQEKHKNWVFKYFKKTCKDIYIIHIQYMYFYKPQEYKSFKNLEILLYHELRPNSIYT